MEKLITQVFSDYESNPPKSVLKLIEECRKTNKRSKEIEISLMNLSKTQEKVEQLQKQFAECKEEALRLQKANERLTKNLENKTRMEIRRSSAPNKKNAYKPSIHRGLKASFHYPPSIL